MESSGTKTLVQNPPSGQSQSASLTSGTQTQQEQQPQQPQPTQNPSPKVETKPKEEVMIIKPVEKPVVSDVFLIDVPIGHTPVLEIQQSQIDKIVDHATRITKHVPKFSKAKIKSFSIPARYYPSFKDLADHILKEFERHFSSTTVTLSFVINPLTGKIKFESQHGKVSILTASEYFGKHLGVRPTKYTVLDVPNYMVELEHKGKSRAYLDEIFQIFVYSDIIDYQIVGNTKKPLRVSSP